MINYEDFSRMELKVGTILEAGELPESEKLIKLKVDIGEEQHRQILAGIKQWYTPEKLVGKQVVVVANLEPRMMMGLESQGMLLAADTSTTLSTSSGKPVLLKPSQKVPSGTKVR